MSDAGTGRRGLGGGEFGAGSPLFGGSADPFAEPREQEAGEGPPTETASPADPGPDPLAGLTFEERAELLRELLPATEPERTVDSWGRSERMLEHLNPLFEFYYRYWFRVEVEGIENIPSEGGALLVSNHSGALPPDAPMIMQAIRNEHSRPRPVYMLGEHWFKGYPGISMIVNKIGMVPAHRANAQRLLRDEGQLVLVFPEGQKGTRKMYWQRYQLRRFGRGGFVRTALRAGVPIVPVALIGAEEAMPIFAHFRTLQKLTGLIYFPLTPTFPHFGLAGALMFMPAKFRIRFMEPVDLGGLPPETIDDPAEVQVISERIRTDIQHQLDGMLDERESVWLG